MIRNEGPAIPEPADSSAHDQPADWQTIELNTVVRASRETIDPQCFPEELFDYYSIPAYQDGKRAALTPGAAIHSQKILLRGQVLLFGKLNPRVPKVWLVDGGKDRRAIASTEFIALIPIDDQIDAEFLYFLCWSEYVLPRAQALVSGSTPSRQRVDVYRFLELQVPLPPIDEQRAIARVLRTVQRAKEATENVIAAARELKKSLTRHLFTYGPIPVQDTGSALLTDSAVGPLPKGWRVSAIGEHSRLCQYGLNLRGMPTGKYPLLRMNNIQDGGIEGKDLKYVDLDLDAAKKFQLASGDILFNRTNSADLVGKSALFDLPGFFVFASYLIRVRLDAEKLTPWFLNYYLNAPWILARLRSLASRGVSQSNINATKLRQFEVPLPPLEEQRQIAEILRVIDRKLDAERHRLSALSELFRSLLTDLVSAARRV